MHGVIHPRWWGQANGTRLVPCVRLREGLTSLQSGRRELALVRIGKQDRCRRGRRERSGRGGLSKPIFAHLGARR